MSFPPPPPGFVLDDQPAPRRRAASSVPPPPPGFELDEPEGPRSYAPVDLPSLGNDSIVSAIDGDTARLASGRNLRMFGADAPELKQQGWDRAGQPVPIGQQSRQALSDRLARGTAVLGALRGESYGRPVAPFTVGGEDVGRTMIRAGEAYAAPSYMKADPERSAIYMAAERLARLNRLGVHGVYAQTPSDFRHDPQLSPERETVARFWDTPTPWAGLRPEVEKRIMEMSYNPKVPLSEVAEYAKANGGTLDVEATQKARDHFLKYGQAGGIEYRDGPRILTDQGDGVTGAAGRGFGTGALAGGLDEAGAVVDSLGLTDGRENVFNSDRRFADIWANNQAQNSAILGFDDQEHPYATTAGSLAGGLVAPFGAGARTVPQLFRVGAAYGGAAGFLGTDGSLGERAIGGAIGVPLGGALGAGAGKALELAGPLARSAWARMRGRAGEGAGALVDDAARIGIETRDEPPPPPGFVLDDAADDVVPPPGFVLDDAAEDLAEAGGASVRGLGRVDDIHSPSSGDVPPPPRIAGSGDEAALMPGNVRMWRSGDGANGGWFTSSREYAEQLARRDEAPLWYADVSRDHPAFAGAVDGQGPEQGFTFNHEFGPGELNATPVTALSDEIPPPPGFMLMADDAMPSISQEMRRPDYLFTDRPAAMDQPLTDAQRAAMAERIDPRDLTPLPSNEIGSAEELAGRDTGRFARATAPNERGELTRQTVRSYNGAEVPKVGPIDLVGFLRLRGGLADQGGELSHMGLTNQARRGMDFVGQEQRFGPLVNDQGARLDDAAEAAWEAGYFPDHTERPTTAEFLDALRDTHEGRNRHFLPEDYAEIDRFYGAQGERYALQQHRFETGQLILRDRSVPAEEPQPFAPPEAYEEWGTAGGPDFAGNIRLEKLDTPQDIARALSTIERRVGFDAATRGRVSQAETERLAAELNMTPETLIARRKGQAFNAEEALAARQILAKSSNELVNAAKRIKALDEPGDELLADFQQKLVRHVAIQEQVAGLTAEAGRALQQFRQVADSRAVRKDVLTSLVQAGGGKGRIQDAADILLDAVESEPGKFNTLADKLSKPKFSDKLVELYINGLLSRPATHVVNIVSNTLTALGQLPEHAIAATLGKGRELARREAVDRVTSSEVGARAFGLLQGAKEGARLFTQSLRTGEPSDVVSKVEGIGMKAISGTKGDLIRIPTRLLTAEDEFFKGIARRMELNGEAVRIARKEGLKGEAAAARIAELTANPTDEMLERSFDYARYLTFQRPLGSIAGGAAAMTRDAPVLKLVMTFIRTPTNLLKFATERSPAAPLLKEWRKDFMAGGEKRDLAIARMMVGTGFGAAIYEAALNGHLTGSAPSDPVKAQFMRANGWQPYSIKLGDKYYSYSRLDPFSTTMGVAADLALKRDGMTERQLEDYSALMVASVINNLANKTWLSGASDFLEATSDWERYGPAYMRKLTASMVTPGISSTVAQAIDPTMRDSRSVGDAITARIPGLSSTLPAKRDIWGQAIAVSGGLGPDFASPIWASTDRNDPISREALATGARFSPPQRSYTAGGKRVQWTPQQYEQLSALAGQSTRGAIGSLMQQPDWASRSKEARATAIRKAADLAKKMAKAEVLGVNPPRDAATRRKGLFGQQVESSAGSPPPPPPGFAVEGEAAGVNVYADIQKAIPGVRVTSGFRTPEYQAEMRRRGYRPATNSAHLDGSALDLLPPAGKSMGWLRDQVRAQYPNARLLNEGDHLHAIFPGYYGAPVLGGARAAGLKNPLAGMPPPPPGFVLE